MSPALYNGLIVVLSMASLITVVASVLVIQFGIDGGQEDLSIVFTIVMIVLFIISQGMIVTLAEDVHPSLVNKKQEKQK